MESNQNTITQELIQQFIDITNTDENTAQYYFSASSNNSSSLLQEAIRLFFATGENNSDDDEMDDNYDNSYDSIVDEFMTLAQGIPAMRNMLQNGQLSNIVSLLGRVEQSVSEYEYPETIEQFTTQMLYTWGKNSPHHCPSCAVRAFITFIKLKNIDPHSIIRLIPPRVLEHNNIDNQEKKDKIITDILNNIDGFYNKICEYVIMPFDMIYQKYEYQVNKNKQNINDFLFLIEQNISHNFRIIWEALHQSNFSQVIPKCLRINKLNELANSQTFIQFITNQWVSKIYNHPASNEALACLKHDKLDTQNKIIELELTGEKCAICFDEFIVGTEITRLGCHTFCKECIMPWLSKHNNTCPVCRKEIINDDRKCSPTTVKSQSLPAVSNTSE